MRGGNDCNNRDRTQCEVDSNCIFFNNNCIPLEKPINRSLNYDDDSDDE